MDEFKCRVCECTKYHTKEIGEGKTTDKIIDLRNPKLDARIILKACADCHVVFAYWESFKEAKDIPEQDKKIAKEVLAPKAEGER